jgi:predicted dehydrogenase
VAVFQPVDAARPVRWGIASTGGIAHDFALALSLLPDAEIVAVASRSAAAAEAFADTHGIRHRHASYEAMAGDDEVDVVYVGTPHSRHCDDALLYLHAGKHVLCEKPLALNHDQAARMAHAARSRGRFLMEAIWSRFLPAYVELRRLVAGGAIGDVRLVEASFGFAAPFDSQHRLFDLSLGGGALLDVGLYPVQLAHMLLGPPDDVRGVAHLGPTGADEQSAVLLHYADGPLAVVLASITTAYACTARVSGTKGAIDLPPRFHCPAFLDLRVGTTTTRLEVPYDRNGLHYEAEEVHRCLRAGDAESVVMPLADSCAIARTLDRAREQIGLRYPGE